MGRGSYTAADWAKLRNSRNLGNAQSETEIFRKTECDPRFDPKYIQAREARDSEDHPESLPIIIGLDVTGSMGYLAKEVAQQSLNETMMKLYSTNAVKDPALLFAAYGDYSDRSPLQVTQFESDIRIAEQLLDLWLENGGSGQVSLSGVWHFASKHTLLDNYEKRGKKGFLFTIGDRAACRNLGINRQHFFDRVFGDNVTESEEEILAGAQKKFEVFHLFLDNDLRRAESIVNLLPGHTMVIREGDIAAIPEILISVIQMTLGMNIKDVLAQWDELKQPIVKEALQYLSIKDIGGIIF